MQYKHILIAHVVHGGDSDYPKANHLRELSPSLQVVREESQQLDNVWNL